MTNSNSAGVYLYYSINDVPVYSFGWLAFATLLACHLTLVFNNNNKNGWILTMVSTVHNNEKGYLPVSKALQECFRVNGAFCRHLRKLKSFETCMNFLLL